jgi:hypothetical protein
MKFLFTLLLAALALVTVVQSPNMSGSAPLGTACGQAVNYAG